MNTTSAVDHGEEDLDLAYAALYFQTIFGAIFMLHKWLYATWRFVRAGAKTDATTAARYDTHWVVAMSTSP